MKLTEFLTVCANLGRAWPQTTAGGKDLPYKRINMFAFIDEEPELESNTAGKDARYGARTPYFFARGWENSGFRASELKKEFPAVFCYSKSGKIDEPKDREEIRLQFVVQDQYIRTLEASPETQRTKEEIHDSVRELRDQFITGLLSMVKNPNVGEYRPESWLEANGYGIQGSKLKSMIRIESSDIAVTFPQDPGGGLIHSYFMIVLNADICREVPVWQY